MIARTSLLAVLTVAIATPGATALAQDTCSGSLSGATTARFTCTAAAKQQGESVTFTVKPAKRIAGVRALAIGGFELKTPLELKPYTAGAVSGPGVKLTTDKRRVFRAGTGKAPRGELSVSVEHLEREASGATLAHVSVHATLVPDGGKSGTVELDAQFSTTW